MNDEIRHFRSAFGAAMVRRARLAQAQDEAKIAIAKAVKASAAARASRANAARTQRPGNTKPPSPGPQSFRPSQTAMLRVPLIPGKVPRRLVEKMMATDLRIESPVKLQKRGTPLNGTPNFRKFDTYKQGRLS